MKCTNCKTNNLVKSDNYNDVSPDLYLCSKCKEYSICDIDIDCSFDILIGSEKYDLVTECYTCSECKEENFLPFGDSDVEQMDNTTCQCGNCLKELVITVKSEVYQNIHTYKPSLKIQQAIKEREKQTHFNLSRKDREKQIETLNEKYRVLRLKRTECFEAQDTGKTIFKERIDNINNPTSLQEQIDNINSSMNKISDKINSIKNQSQYHV